MARSINTPISDLRHIRDLMERSRYFIGLSGLSGVGAGVSALFGVMAIVVYGWAAEEPVVYGPDKLGFTSAHPWGIAPVPYLFCVATLVLTGALASGFYFTNLRVVRMGQEFAHPRTYKLLTNLALPLAIGGVFCLALIYHGYGGLIGPTTIIFYGLALLNGSNFVSEELRLLAYLEIGLGLVALFFTPYGLYFWAVGFGLLHIVYGLWMYFKYDTNEQG
ncbi:hypothetical protein [Lewinella sp. IMCC34191]|uniref:hypothetical protein n=1 Tax=Lewinella sp. IMCC34191 TaxID=2259172 RepID=UPI000E22E35B|nr:hypothetical protein [Lewinella sp. IMCC34191]